MHNKHLLFSLGTIYGTPAALAAIERADVSAFALLARHAAGDWSEMVEEDQQANRDAVADGSRVFSAYHLRTGVKLWIITEADRSATTVLLPDEY